MSQPEDSFNKFIEHVYTKDQLGGLINDIETAKILAYKNEQNISLSKKVESKVSDSFTIIVGDLESEGTIPNDGKMQVEYFTELKEYCLGLPVCTITISFQTGIQFLGKVSDWFQREVGKKIILNIVISEEIVAGAKIEFKGKYRDFSISERIDYLLEKSYLGGVKK